MIATINRFLRRGELAEQVALLVELADAHKGLSEVTEEQLFVLCICLNPGFELGILSELEVGLRFVVL